MIIFKDLLTGYEMFTDACKPGTEGPDGFLITIQGKMKPKGSSEISDKLIGANPSQEHQEEQGYATQDAETESDIDIAMDYNLREVSEVLGSKKQLKLYMKKWVNNVATALKEDKEKCECFKTSCTANIGKFLEKWSPGERIYIADDGKFDAGTCGFDEGKCSLIIGTWGDDGVSMTFYAVRAAIEEEKS